MNVVIKKKTDLLIRKSKFIGMVFEISSRDEVDFYLKEIKKVHKRAAHIPYAFIIDTESYCTDDGEPTNTAGIHILNTLEKHNLNNVVCFVVRYYGGVKLGPGGLIRAFRDVSNVVVESNSWFLI